MLPTPNTETINNSKSFESDSMRCESSLPGEMWTSGQYDESIWWESKFGIKNEIIVFLPHWTPVLFPVKKWFTYTSTHAVIVE